MNGLTVEEGVAFSAMSVAVFEVMRVYKDAAPSLAEMRSASPGGYECRQRALDAEIMAGIIVLVIGAAGVVLTGQWYPLILGAVTLGAVAYYYRAVANSSNEGIVIGNG
jgi:hypothetical protein